MSRITWLATALALVCAAETGAQAERTEAELLQLVADCNGIAASAAPKRRNVRACEALASAGRMSLVEPAAATAYQRYLDERVLECQRRQASPRGQSRGPKDCEP